MSIKIYVSSILNIFSRFLRMKFLFYEKYPFTITHFLCESNTVAFVFSNFQR